jgi:hypothetical protein
LGGAAMVGLLLASLFFPTVARATIVTYVANIQFSGDPLNEFAPWVKVTADDHNSPGSVTLDITNTLSGTENVADVFLNVQPDSLLASLSVGSPVLISGSFDLPTAAIGLNAFHADGDGYFDLDIALSQMDGNPTRFGQGDEVQLTATAPGLTASSFQFLSSSTQGNTGNGNSPNGTYGMVAFIQNAGNQSGLSAWVGDGTTGGQTPEPTSAMLLLIGGLGALICHGWRRMRRKD